MIGTFTLAATHTVSPDHWFPFVMVGRANNWKTPWVLMLALIAGVGHVGTSVAIGMVGVFAESGTSKEVAEFLENATPMMLMIFGFEYAAYALYKQQVGAHGHSHGIPIINKWLGINESAYALPGEDHSHDITFSVFGWFIIYIHKLDLVVCVIHDDHMHSYDATTEEDHEHAHYHGDLLHEHKHTHKVQGVDGFVHDHGENNLTGSEGITDLKNKRAGWGLVAILGLTPCIALLPMTFAAVKYGTLAVILVNIAFAIGTLGTIVLFTWLGYLGLSWIKLDFFEKYGDVIAGAIIGLLGLATKIFEL